MSATLTAPPVRKFTPDDLLRLPDQGKGFELVDGELKEMNPGLLSSYVGGQVLAELSKFVQEQNLGWITGAGASYRCFPEAPDDVRRADVSFHSLTRLTAAQVAAEGHCTIVPDLVVEVISPNDLAYEVSKKQAEWREAGAKLVWIIHPVRQTIHAYRADGTVTLFNRTDTLTADPALPDFRIPVADLFRLPVAS